MHGRRGTLAEVRHMAQARHVGRGAAPREKVPVRLLLQLRGVEVGTSRSSLYNRTEDGLIV